MKETHFSNGKLLLTAEYLVLDGALALAVPTRLGQEFSAEEKAAGKNIIHWTAQHEGRPWLSAEINFCHWDIIRTNLPENAQFILKTLRNVQDISGGKFENGREYYIETNLQFPANFGLGSSSTLMTNLAKWANIDPFLLNETSLGGSGYDIAVAMERSAVLYQLEGKSRKITKVDFAPSFRNELIFVHLNQKQNSREGIQLYKTKAKNPQLIAEISALTQEVLSAEYLSDFSALMDKHERKLSQFLGLKTIKEKAFPDCPAFVKSLGAWGGDFVMTQRFTGYQDYFSSKGYSTILEYEEMVG